MKIIINIFFAFYFFIGMDIIYWNVHKNDKPEVNYKFSNGSGGIGYATTCFEGAKSKICKFGGYMIEVNEYWEVK